MREIKAYIRPERVETVVTELSDAGVEHLTITHVRAFGSGVDPGHRNMSLEAGRWYTETAKLELVCMEPDANDLVRLIEAAARTGQPGDGIVFVLPVERAVKVRTGAEGRKALSGAPLAGASD